MRVLITGSAGFLGRHVTTHFLQAGYDVVAFDQVEQPETGAQSVVGDLRDIDSVRAAAKSTEVICHIGAIGDVYLAGEQPALAAEVNAAGSANVAMAAAEQGARVVYASTWEVYGEPQYQPLDESHPTNPDHPYNITKLAGERLLAAADRLHGVPVTSLRLGTAYGSGLRPNSVFRIFIDRAKRGEPLTIQGDGSQIRQFTHASDIARGFELAALAGLHDTVVNLVAPETTSIRRLAELVVERFPTELTFGEPRPGDVPPAVVSSVLADQVLDWRAQMSFEAGLDELIASLES